MTNTMTTNKTTRNKHTITKKTRCNRGVSSVISTIIITSALLIILAVAAFAATNILSNQMADSEFQQAQSNMQLLNSVVQDVSLRQGAGSYVQFNQITGGIGVATDQQNRLVITAGGQTQNQTRSLTLVPNAGGSYSDWHVYPNGNKWSATSDNNSFTGIELTGPVLGKETENLGDTSQTGTINSVTAYMNASVIETSLNETLFANSMGNNVTGWTTVGSAPYLNNDTSNWVWTKTNNAKEGNFGYSDHTVLGTMSSTSLFFEAKADGDDTFTVELYDGSVWSSIYAIPILTTSYTWNSINVTSFLNSLNKVDKCQVRITYSKNGNADNVYVRRSYLSIKYANPTTAAKVFLKTPTGDGPESVDFNISTSGFSTYRQTFLKNRLGTSWTWSEINDLEIGCNATALSANAKLQVSEFWVEVSYTVVESIPGNAIFTSPALTSLVYRAGTSTSGAAQTLEGSNATSVSVDQPIGYLRIETGSGVKIDLDYNRVRVVTMGQQNVGNTTYNFTGITFIRLKPGSMGGSGTVNVKAQNLAINATYFTYTNSPKDNLIQTYLTSTNQKTTLLTVTAGSNAIIILTVVEVQISIG